MQVPGWLLILLTSLSVTLILIVFAVSYQVFKHWLRTRKYDKIRTTRNSRYVPGKTAAYLKGYNRKSSLFLPLTQPTTIQGYTPLLRATFKAKSLPTSAGSRSGSLYQSKSRPFSTFERKQHQVDLNRCRSMDERIFRQSLAYGLVSPVSTDGSVNGSRSDTFNDGSTIYMEDTPDRGESAYIHSDLIQNNGVNDVSSEVVVSYDQEHSPKNNTASSGLLLFTLEYNSSVPELLITVKNALDLPSATGSMTGRVNSYVNLCIVPEDFLWKRTRLVENDKDPVYAETFQIKDVLYHKLREYTLCFYVMDCHLVMGERVIGKILYPLSDLRAEQLVDVCKELSPP